MDTDVATTEFVKELTLTQPRNGCRLPEGRLFAGIQSDCRLQLESFRCHVQATQFFVLHFDCHNEIIRTLALGYQFPLSSNQACRLRETAQNVEVLDGL